MISRKGFPGWKRKEMRKMRTMLKKALALLLTLVLALPCAAFAEEWAVYEDDSDAMWDNAQWAELNEILYNDETGATLPDSYSVTVNNLSVTEGLNEDVMNILLLGVDDKVLHGRTDAMLVLSVNVKNGSAKLISIDRDTYVCLPQIGRWNRVNTAYVFGGTDLAMKTVNELLGLNITHYAVVDFNGFAAIIDLLGGVDISLSGGEAKEISVTKPVGTGMQTLNGAQALAYARIRSVDSTFGRNLLITLLNKVIATNGLSQILDLVEAMLPYLATNLTTNELINLIFNVLPYYQEMGVYSYPADGEWQYWTTPSGASVVTVQSPDSAAANVRAFIYGE